MEKKRDNKLIKYIIILLSIFALSLLGLIIFILSSDDMNNIEEEVIESSKKENINNKMFKEERDKYIEMKREMGAQYPVDKMILNLISDKKNSYLKTEIILEFEEDDITFPIEKYDPIIKNDILLIISNTEYHILLTPKGKDILKEQIKNQLNDRLNGQLYIINVYFTTFVIQ